MSYRQRVEAALEVLRKLRGDLWGEQKKGDLPTRQRRVRRPVAQIPLEPEAPTVGRCDPAPPTAGAGGAGGAGEARGGGE